MFFLKYSTFTENIPWKIEKKKKLPNHHFVVFMLFVVLIVFEKYTRVLDYVSENQARMDVGNAENILKYVKE